MISPKPTRYHVKECGIQTPLLIVGDLQVLLPGTDIPIVFLIDENHGSPECIQQNIANAKELLSKAGVMLVGVESHAGGKEWDGHEGRYNSRFDLGEDKNAVSNCPGFANEMRSSSARVLGVESRSMSDEQQGDFCVGGSWYGKPEKDHPLNERRSEHFLRTLFDLRRTHGLSGNLVLNAGGDHNSHIAKWITEGSVAAKAGQAAAYVRLRAPAYHT